MEEMRTQVMVTKGSLDSEENDFVYKVVNDSTKMGIYGVMQHVETVDDTATSAQMESKARAILQDKAKVETTSDIEFIGDIRCITGSLIEVNDSTTGISGTFFITADSHSFSDGVHKMSLQLSKNIGSLKVD